MKNGVLKGGEYPIVDGSSYEEFNNELQDEDQLDAHPPPGVEIGYDVEHYDHGSGSFAEDGRLEVAEDRPMYDGEDPSHVGSAAMYGPTEIGRGNGPYASEGASEIGLDAEGGYIAKYGQSEIGHGLYPVDGASEIGEELGAGLYPVDGASEIGYGPYALDGAAEIGAGHYPTEGASEVGAGLYPTEGASEIGAEDLMQPFETFMLEKERIGDWYPEQGYGTEVGAALAVTKVVEKARDNRQAAPPMKAVDVDAPLEETEDSFLSDVVLGAAATTGVDQFPLLSKLLLRAGAATEPRYVRVDTEASYKQFRAGLTPEVAELHDKLEQHLADPAAHGAIVEEDIDDDIEDLVHLGAAADAAETEKRVELWMPRRFEGKLEAWLQGDEVFASIALPGPDGEVRIATTQEPVAKSVDEMTRHAAEANVPASTVVGVLPAMGCVLGAGTAIKEMAAAAPAILARPEAQHYAPFMVRIEPKLSPNLAALVMLACECRRGNPQACDEWRRLGAGCIGPVNQAMVEAVNVLKAATGA